MARATKKISTTNASKKITNGNERMAYVHGQFRNLQAKVSKLPDSAAKKEILSDLNETFAWTARGFFELGGPEMSLSDIKV